MEFTTGLGNVSIHKDVIATIAGVAAVECYGLIGMYSRNNVKDGFTELLGRENLNKGVEIKTVDGEVIIDLYIVVSYGTKINEVAYNIIDKVRYTVENITGLSVGHVNVNVQGVKVINS
ncbi:Asp23/Gls24 family envelope stress response protein [Alkalicella caledoniensis]|uniref:Asp23/Gls24 family envelope stress response protein n=1 Tax=Alkalicella caledoniensis TaxID=2731377 RepID=A0A7G9WCE6_ALKCA|nr:Asp23/Gls24 family envelope stress response protein [Alkalicella caledoniensis]QNO16358.1 Asp23/Gls24 family envelope stress response protein [Alkalicella caledoniensis]